MTNQLVDTADAVPDFDEYAHLTTQEIACAVQYAKPDSEEMYRAVAAISARAPGIGHNKAPLKQALDDELRLHRARVAELVELAQGALIPDGDDNAAAKVSDLIAMIKAFFDELETIRKERGKPYHEGWKLINASYAPVTMRLVTARDELTRILTEHDDKRKAKAEAERKAALAEQKERERLAAEAQRRADEAAQQGSGAASAQLDLLQAREEAERAAARAAAIRPVPIRSHLGTVTRRRDPKHQITDPMKFAGWLIEQPTYKNHLLQALNTIAGQVKRDAKIDAVEEGLDIPGLKTWVEQGAASVRR